MFGSKSIKKEKNNIKKKVVKRYLLKVHFLDNTSLELEYENYTHNIEKMINCILKETSLKIGNIYYNMQTIKGIEPISVLEEDYIYYPIIAIGDNNFGLISPIITLEDLNMGKKEYKDLYNEF